MEKPNLPSNPQLLLPSSLPSLIPTAAGSRSAADPILSPQNVRRFKPDEIDYGSIVLRDEDSVRRFWRSIRELGVVQICDHGILTEELRSVLGNSDRVFGLTVECCTSCGDHEKIVWRGDDGRIAEEAAAAIGHRNYQIFHQKIENVARQVEAIAKELTSVIAQSGTIELVNQPSLFKNALELHGVTGAYKTLACLDSAELCLESMRTNSSFYTKPNSIVVTTGKELEELRVGELGELKVKPFLQTNRASFSIEQKWSSSKLKMDKLISLWDQILILLVIGLLYNFFTHIFS